MKQYSFLMEYQKISKNKESHILNNTVYHSSHLKLDVIKGSKTENAKDRFGFGCVYVSPYKYLSSMYIIDKYIILKSILEHYPQIDKHNIHNIICGMKTFLPKLKQLKEHDIQTKCCKQSIVDVYIEDQNKKWIQFKDYVQVFDGYLYYINYEDYKQKAYQDHDAAFEFAIKGNVIPYKCEKISCQFLVKCWDHK